MYGVFCFATFAHSYMYKNCSSRGAFWRLVDCSKSRSNWTKNSKVIQTFMLANSTRPCYKQWTRFICCVKSYSEVGSKDYLIASDKRVCLLFGSWLGNPLERTETRGKNFWRKSLFQVRAGPVKGTETRQGWKNSTTLFYYGMITPSSEASNAMHLHP